MDLLISRKHSNPCHRGTGKQHDQQQIEETKVSSTDWSIRSAMCASRQRWLCGIHIWVRRNTQQQTHSLSLVLIFGNWRCLKTRRFARCDVGVDALDSSKVWDDLQRLSEHQNVLRDDTGKYGSFLFVLELFVHSGASICDKNLSSTLG